MHHVERGLDANCGHTNAKQRFGCRFALLLLGVILYFLKQPDELRGIQSAPVLPEINDARMAAVQLNNPPYVLENFLFLPMLFLQSLVHLSLLRQGVPSILLMQGSDPELSCVESIHTIDSIQESRCIVWAAQLTAKGGKTGCEFLVRLMIGWSPQFLPGICCCVP